MATKDLSINIRVNDLASGKIRPIRDGLGEIGQTGGVAAAGITKMLGPIGIAIASFATLKKVIGEVASSVKLFAGFDDTMRKVGAVTKATESELKAMTETAKLMGATTRYTATQAAEALSFLGMAGFSASDAMAALPDVLNLAAAGGLDLGVAADIATNILSGFGLEISQLSRVNDVLAETFTNSNTTLSELGEGFKYVGPIAKGVGADFEDLLAAMGKLGDAGIKASMAGTTLRGILEALFNPTNEEAALMKELSARMGGVGLQIKDAQGNFVGFSSVVRQLEKAALTGGEALRLFGARSGPGMAALVEVGADALEELENKLNNVDNTASTISAKMEGGLGGAFRTLVSAVEGFSIQFGESFGTRIIPSVEDLTNLVRKLTLEIKNLDESGVIDNITYALSKMVETFTFGTEFGVAYIKEYTNALGIAFNTLTGDLEEADQKVGKVGASFRKLLSDRNIIGTDQQIQVAMIDKQIQGLEKEAALTKEKIEIDRKDIEGWRSKILGQKVYQDQLVKHNEELQEIFQKIWDLNRTKLKIQTDINLEKFSEDFVAQVRTIQKESIKIGTGAGAEDELKTKAKEYAEEYKRLQQLRENAAKELKLTNDRMLADLRLKGVELERDYQLNLISVNDYYEARRAIIEKSAQLEIDLLQSKADQEVDATKRENLNTDIYKSKQKLTENLIRLDIEYYKIKSKLEEEDLKAKADLDKKRLEAEQAYKDIQLRILAGSSGEMEAQFMQEIADLQDRQNREKEVVEQGLEDKAKLEEYYRQQKIERDQLEFSQWRRLTMSRLELSKEIAGGMAQSFADLYELTGEKQKEWFYLAKAAALAETAINTSQGIMKAWAQGGTFGAVGAALVAVQGAIQTAKILSTGLAEGGQVPGSSPNPKADNILARLTAGEYVQPVDTVKHYGLGVMEALRNKLIPREAFGAIGMKVNQTPRLAFAEGGPVSRITTIEQPGRTGNERITIFNYTDKQEMLSALSSADGVNAIVNLISANREKVSRVLR